MEMRCIYCLSVSTGSTNRAHVAPEALLKNNLTLPIGAECDTCNERLGRMDDAFVHHNRIWAPIFLLGAPGKRGRTRKELGVLKRVGDSAFTARIPEEWIAFGPENNSAHVTLPDLAQYNDGRFRRGLHHMAFNYLTHKRGVGFVHESRFDPVRHYIRFAAPNESWPYAQTMYPDDAMNRTLRLTIMDSAPGLVVRFISYLDEFFVDLLNTGLLHSWAAETLPEGTGLL